MEGVFHFKSWFLNAPGLIHSRAYYWNLRYLAEFDTSDYPQDGQFELGGKGG